MYIDMLGGRLADAAQRHSTQAVAAYIDSLLLASTPHSSDLFLSRERRI